MLRFPTCNPPCVRRREFENPQSDACGNKESQEIVRNREISLVVVGRVGPSTRLRHFSGEIWWSGGVLEGSWGALGALLGALGALLGRSWGALGTFLALLGASWGLLALRLTIFFDFLTSRRRFLTIFLDFWCPPVSLSYKRDS